MPEMTVEELLDTRAGLALAKAAWSEGSGAMLRAVNASGLWRKPENPYSPPLLALCAQPTEPGHTDGSENA